MRSLFGSGGKMNITEKQLCEMMKGFISFVQKDGWFRFSRFTNKQSNYYFEKTPDTLYPKTLATAGMKLECITNAEELSFDFRVFAASSRTFYSVDLYIDGILCDQMYVMNFLRKKSGHVSFALPEGTHRITIYFPNLMRMDLANICLTGAGFAEPVSSKMKILCLGDSITQGYDAYHSSLSYVNRLSETLDAEILDQAIGGEIFDAKILDEELPFDSDLVLVAYGTNDWAVQPNYETFITAAEEFFKKIKEIYPEKKLVYISPIWRGDFQRPFGNQDTNVGAFDESVAALQSLAKENGLFVVDGISLTPHISDFFADQILHPNDLGFGFYAENLLKALKKEDLI
ncbi:MAG: SGNH/GDSL hydrolase family protein [Ruminococcaceae bacterium]|nr:SGNH/GDSL hydrolase family protein [Oscillospiraceae bacterium]